MKELTQEQYDRLTPYKEHLTRGYYGKYTYCLTRKIFNALVEVYRELGYTRNMDYSCSSCLLALTSTLGELYFKFKPITTETNSKQPVKVQQYTLEGELVAEYDSISQAGRQTGISKGSISAALKSGKPTGEYIWKNA